jgi:two-component system, OmpR family, sensor kinase
LSTGATTQIAIPIKRTAPERHWSLRVHLLISYLLLLFVALGVMGVTLMVGLIVQPAPPQSTYQGFASLIRGLNISSLATEYERPNKGKIISETIRVILNDFGSNRDTRMLMLMIPKPPQNSTTATTPNSPIDARVVYDSAGLFTEQTLLYITPDNYVNMALQKSMPPAFHQVYGSFRNTDQQEWLFGGVTRDPRARQSFEIWTVMAEPRPTVSLQEALNDFSTALLPPLLQASCVGLLVALTMAILMTRILARPLQALARGASAVATGDYKHRVAEIGPSEMRAVAGAFNDMGRQVRDTQQSQRDFLANVSHDLKTPLTSIQGYAQAIIDGATKNPSAAAQIIYDESARLNRLVLELTDLMRMQSGRFSLNMQPLDVSEIVAAIGQRLSVVAERKGVRLILKTPSVPSVTGDGDRLAQVLTNLLSNAIHYTPEDGTVMVRTQVNHNGIEIQVQDTGIGIPASELPRIFERFYQVDKVRPPNREGSGLGLAITKQIVQAHGGYIRAESAGHNQGTTFTVWLPSPNLTTIIARRSKA